MMELIINLETLIEDVEVPVGGPDAFQVRSDGILLNGKLHFWENILWVGITNRGVIKSLTPHQT